MRTKAVHGSTGIVHPRIQNGAGSQLWREDRFIAVTRPTMGDYVAESGPRTYGGLVINSGYSPRIANVPLFDDEVSPVAASVRSVPISYAFPDPLFDDADEVNWYVTAVKITFQSYPSENADPYIYPLVVHAGHERIHDQRLDGPETFYRQTDIMYPRTIKIPPPSGVDLVAVRSRFLKGPLMVSLEVNSRRPATTVITSVAVEVEEGPRVISGPWPYSRRQALSIMANAQPVSADDLMSPTERTDDEPSEED